MPIYETTTPTLNEIIRNASNGSYLVPDIQRQYVWTPDKIIMLIDTLLKGWPFSNLLLWDAGEIQNRDQLIPHRPFKRIISRHEAVTEEHFAGANVPNNITMVLDGQQRIQSLLLAFGANDAKLTLLDKDWYSSFSDDKEHPYRGSAVNQRYCSASLYIDPNQLISDNNIVETRRGFTLNRAIDWTKIFKWAIPSAEDIGGTQRSENYPYPLDKLFNQESSKIPLIRASHLWDAATGFTQLSIKEKDNKIKNLTEQYHIGLNEKLEDSLLELTEIISRIKDQQIPCLKLLPKNQAGYTDNDTEYSEIIVNIFNRLNAAGAPLKEDEICSAWIRNKWDQLRENPNIPLNQIRAKNLYNTLKENFTFTKLDDKDVVTILNIIWATYGSTNNDDSRIFTSADLLNGNIINKMTSWLYDNTNDVIASITKTNKFLENSNLKFNYHLKSKNAIFSLILYTYGDLILRNNAFIQAESEHYYAEYKIFLTRWLLISLLGGRWARNSDSDIKNLIQHIRYHCRNLRNINDYFDLFLIDNKNNCRKYINDYDHGDQYSRARLVFYAWNLSIGKINEVGEMDMPSIDHLIPKNTWVRRLSELGINDEKLVNKVHEIGNLNELGRFDNSSKNDRSLEEWLQHANSARKEIRQQYLTRLKTSFHIPEQISNPSMTDKNSILEIIIKIEERTKLIKDSILSSLGLNNNQI